MAGIVDWFLTWWLRSGRYPWSKLRRKLFEAGYLKTELPTVASLGDIESCLKTVTWTMDGPLHLFDSISYPQTVWKRKKDDCDGFAVLACELLDRLNPSCAPALVTVMVRPVKKSHSVCVFTAEEGGLSVFDNGRLKTGFTGYPEVIAMLTEKAERLICWDARKHDTFELLEFSSGVY